jgi:hypothetical protein
MMDSKLLNVYRVSLTFVSPVLGATPKDPDVYERYVASRAALEDEELAEELATVEKVEERGWTGFQEKDGELVTKAYVVKGFFKEACQALRQVEGSKSKKLGWFKKWIDGLVFVKPDWIPMKLPEGGEVGVLERPLRTDSWPPRVALARSDMLPEGTTMVFEVVLFGNKVTEEMLREWLDYGAWKGFRQWRNAGYGRFVYELVKV